MVGFRDDDGDGTFTTLQKVYHRFAAIITAVKNGEVRCCPFYIPGTEDKELGVAIGINEEESDDGGFKFVPIAKIIVGDSDLNSAVPCPDRDFSEWINYHANNEDRSPMELLENSKEDDFVREMNKKIKSMVEGVPSMPSDIKEKLDLLISALGGKEALDKLARMMTEIEMKRKYGNEECEDGEK